jgi:hypothetical protein
MMFHSDEEKKLRKTIFEERKNGEYSEGLKQRVVTYVRRERSKGVSFASLERGLSISDCTIRRWLKTRDCEHTMRLLPVHIVSENDIQQSPIQEANADARMSSSPPGASLRLVLPQGAVLEGLSLAQACEFLKMWGG